MKRVYFILLFLFGIASVPQFISAQEIDLEKPTDDLGNVSDAFQENFFEALKQKGIENYELALDALQKAEKAAKNDSELEAVIFFERGKNLASLQQYDAAEENFTKVLAFQKNQMDVMEALYDVYYRQNDYENAIPLVQKLSELDIDYKEDLANLYNRTQEYDKALKVLDEIDESLGESEYRNALRTRIYRLTGNKEAEIDKLEERVGDNSKNERDYLNLIYLYSQEGDTEKAFTTAKELLKNNPKSELVHFALYKFYLDEGNTEQALASMKIVFKSATINNEDKYKVLSDFIEFVSKNPSYEPQLEEAIVSFSEDGTSGGLYEKIGAYFLAKDNKEKALGFFEKGSKKDPDNFSLLKNTMLLMIELGKNKEVVTMSENALEIFPAQPILYLLNGVANNNVNESDRAIEALETGVDYLFENPTMEKDFYEQLGIAYTKKGDSENAKKYADKAAAINISN